MAAITAARRIVPGTARIRIVVLGALTVLLGGVATWSGEHAAQLRADPAARNSALSDNARTSEVTGQITSAVNTVFSYNYADVGKTDTAAQRLLTGKAVQEYDQMFSMVRAQAPQQKQILTTTVTNSAVKAINGDRARLLIFADQRNTRTDKNQTSFSATVFAVDAIRINGKWKIDNIDTLGA